MATISAGIVTNYGADSSMMRKNLMWFFWRYLTIRNKEGRSLAIENVSSSDGNMTVTPVNELEAAVLASQNAFASEMRVRLNTGAFGLGLSATELIVSYLLLMGNKTQQLYDRQCWNS